MSALPYLAQRDKACPKGEHLTETKPVVCVPNKERDTGGINIDPRIIDTAWAILTLAALILSIRQFYLWWRRRRSPAAAIEGQAASGLAAGALMSSPSLGLGDLGWGSARHGFYIPPDALAHHVVIAGGTGSGKTNSAEVIEYRRDRRYQPQIIHFDCKGSRNGMARFLAMTAAAGIPPERVRLFPVEAYDGWRGGSDHERALLGRLVQVQDWSESFYEAGTKDLLQQVLFDVAPTQSSRGLPHQIGRNSGGL